MIEIPRPGALVDIVLPSLHSCPPPKIVLTLEGLWDTGVSLRAWEGMVGHLCRAAKQFKATHPERKMEVEVSIGRCYTDYTNVLCDKKALFVRWLKSGDVMLRLKEDANLVVTDEDI